MISEYSSWRCTEKFVNRFVRIVNGFNRKEGACERSEQYAAPLERRRQGEPSCNEESVLVTVQICRLRPKSA